VSRLRGAALAAAVAVFAAGCGTTSPTTISSGAADTLRTDVRALSMALADQRWTAADIALAQLRTDLAAATSGGGVSPERAQAIRADVAAVAGDLAAHRRAARPLPPLTSNSSRPTPKPAPNPGPRSQPKPKPKPPKPPHDHGHGHGHGDGGD
jgi:hypothetical protein